MIPAVVMPLTVTVPPVRNVFAFVTVGWMHAFELFARFSFAASSCPARQPITSFGFVDEQLDAVVVEHVLDHDQVRLDVVVRYRAGLRLVDVDRSRARR